MHRFDPPPKPPGFDEATAEPARKVAKAMAAGRRPIYDEKMRVWKRYTGNLSAAQHQKCGYCEARAAVTGDPDVDHFHPKNAVAWLSEDPKDWGTEVPNLARLKGRRPKRLIPQGGYWWLAYEWSNYLLSCPACNRKWKLTIFPVHENDRATPPRKDRVETPLLLNPFTGPHPIDHLSFDEFGAIEPRNGSRHGKETIKTCGLNRDQLRDARIEKALDTHELVNEFLARPAAARAIEILRLIRRKGEVQRDHCGMVRAIFQQKIGMSWAELERRLDVNPAPPSQLP